MIKTNKILFLDLGRKCTRKCDYCFNDPDIKYESTTKKAKDIIRKYNKLGCESLIFTGGEPLFRKDIFDLIKYAYGTGYKRTKIQTNGDLFDRKIFDKLINAKVSTLMFSYHKSNFSKIYNSIEELLQNKIYVEFNYVINKKTYKNMINFLKKFKKYKDKISFYFTFMTIKPHLIKKHPELLLSLTESKKEIHKLCSFAKNNRYNLVIEDVPRCILGKYYSFSSDYQRKINNVNIYGYTENYMYYNMELVAERALLEKEKLDYCYECIYLAECTGVPKGYSQFFKNEKKLVNNITFNGKCIDQYKSMRISNNLLPVLFYLKNKSLLNSKEFLSGIKKLLKDKKIPQKLTTTDIPLCFLKDVDIINFPYKSEKNILCEGCFYERICNNSLISKDNHNLIKKFYTKPLEAKVEITDKCNQDCSYCINRLTFKSNKYFKKKELDKKELFRFFMQLKKLGTKIIRITGGEPLVRKDLLDILRFIKNKGFYVKLNTNLLLYNKNKKIFGYTDDVLISFNELPFIKGYNKKNYSIKIRNIKDLKKKVKNIAVSIIIYDKLIENFDKLIDFCERLQVNNFVFLLPFKIHNKKISYNKLHHFIFRLNELNNNSKKKYLLGHPLPFCQFTEELTRPLINFNFLFEYGIAAFVLDPYGNLRTNYFNKETFGNIKKHNLLELLKAMRNKISYWSNLKIECRKCVHLVRCGGILDNHINEFEDIVKSSKF